MTIYVVKYEMDDVMRLRGTCTTDHELERGDFIDVRDERAVVLSCNAVNVEKQRTANQGQSHTTERKPL